MLRSMIEVIRRSLDCLLPHELPAALRMIERYRSMHWIDDDEAETWERSVRAKLEDLFGESDAIRH
jgi:hypothetical protein